MNNDLKNVIDYMEREKGLDRNILLDTIKSSLESAARKSVTGINNPIIEIDPETFGVTVYGEFLILEDGKRPRSNEITLVEAKKLKADAELDKMIMVEVTPNDFGRIAAQTAKQVIIQKIREAEADVLFNEYKDKVDKVISGTVRQVDRKFIIIDLGRGEALLQHREKIDIEDYHIGDRLKLYVLDVRKNGHATEVLVSRSHPNLIRMLFEMEVPEISDGTITIKGIAREPGYRTKIAVFSNEAKVDCVGACVGMRGARVKNIVQELNGEKIDIVPWSEDTLTYCQNALNPAKIKHIKMDEENNRLLILVDKSQFSLAIGKRGSNARLTSKLLGWKIDIEVQEKEMPNQVLAPTVKSAAEAGQADLEESLKLPVEEIEGLSKKVKEYFLSAGYDSLGDLNQLEMDELYAIPGVGKSSAEEIMDHIREALKRVATK